MHDIFIKILALTVSFNNKLFAPIDSFIGSFQLQYWLEDAIKDSVHMLPFLFIIFVIIELIEYFYSNKMNSIVKNSKIAGPLAGSLVASVPQCGFSVIASTLYSKKLITMGTLLSVFISTSDEAIPVLLTYPSKAPMIFQILAVKIIIAIIVGYAVDFISETVVKKTENNQDETELGCCNHNIGKPDKKELILHPITHTLSVFFFILLVTVLINFGVMKAGGEENLGQYFLNDSILQPILTAIFGLIPNCAASIAITMMYIKGAIGFGSTIAGLSSSAGLGILVLLKKNEDIKDTLKILGILLAVSIISGIIIQTFYN